MQLPDTKRPSVIREAMNRPVEERLLTKSVKLQQAFNGVMLTDAAAGLQANRKADRHYKAQQKRALTALVDSRLGEESGEGDSDVADDEDDTVNLDLGDRYEEHTHVYQKPDTVTNTTTEKISTVEKIAGTAAVGSALAGGGITPWILAAVGIPLAAALTGWWVTSQNPQQSLSPVWSGHQHPQQEVNVLDVQSGFKLELYDEDGQPLDYIYTPQPPAPKGKL